MAVVNPRITTFLRLDVEAAIVIPLDPIVPNVTCAQGSVHVSQASKGGSVVVVPPTITVSRVAKAAPLVIVIQHTPQAFSVMKMASAIVCPD